MCLDTCFLDVHKTWFSRAIPMSNINAPTLPLPATEPGMFIADRVLSSVLDIVPVFRVLRPIFVIFVAFRTFIFALIGVL